MAVAQRIAKQWEAAAALRREGVIDAALEAIADQSQRTIESHLADYEAKMQAADRSEKHIASTVRYIRELANAAEWRTAADITADGAARYASNLREQGQSARTIQAMLTAAKGFTRWLTVNCKLPRDPLASVAKPNPKADRKRRRRMLLPDEWGWLLDTVISRQIERYGMPATERALLYATAIQTGLRASELRSLTRARLFLDSDQPFITCSAGSTKNRKPARQFIQLSLADQLREHVATKAMAAPLFNMPADWQVADMLRDDLADARAAWLQSTASDPAEHARRSQSDFLKAINHDGEALDFHALRHTCGAWLAIAGIHPNAIKAVMRHSSITLTMDTYGHLLPGQEAATVAELAAIMPDAMQATGTADARGESAQRLAQRAERPTCQPLASTAIAGRIGDETESRQKPRKLSHSGASGHRMARNVANALSRTRTLDPLIKSQLLYQLS